jgi:hypothetical protein
MPRLSAADNETYVGDPDLDFAHLGPFEQSAGKVGQLTEVERRHRLDRGGQVTRRRHLATVTAPSLGGLGPA